MARMTIRDIARLAGVSVTTVSRALNNAPEINFQTRERVLQVCREQGYRSNLLARSLVSSRTRVLGVILPELSGPFHAPSCCTWSATPRNRTTRSCCAAAG